MTHRYIVTLLVALVTFDLCYGAMPTCYLCVTGDCDTDNPATYSQLQREATAYRHAG